MVLLVVLKRQHSRFTDRLQSLQFKASTMKILSSKYSRKMERAVVPLADFLDSLEVAAKMIRIKVVSSESETVSKLQATSRNLLKNLKGV
jgi:hypothetical protein